VFDEEDVNLLELSDRRFEEACFDLLLSLGYQGLGWRQGSADDGRDIEGRLVVGNALVGTHEERWFFECKRYENGVPPAELNSKIAWADAEGPNHLVILTTSHVTNSGLNWLEKMRPQKPYAIHVVDGKALRRLFSVHAELMRRYFVDPQRKLLLDARRTWLVHNIIPEAETLRVLSRGLQHEKLSPAELAFIWCAANLRGEDVERLIDDSEPFYFDAAFDWLADAANTSAPVLSTADDFELLRFQMGSNAWEPRCKWRNAAELVLQRTSKPRIALYTFARDDEGEGLEVLIEATSDFPTRIRHIGKNAPAAMKTAEDLMLSARLGGNAG